MQNFPVSLRRFQDHTRCSSVVTSYWHNRGHIPSCAPHKTQGSGVQISIVADVTTDRPVVRSRRKIEICTLDPLCSCGYAPGTTRHRNNLRFLLDPFNGHFS